jgi:hypothetical protein
VGEEIDNLPGIGERIGKFLLSSTEVVVVVGEEEEEEGVIGAGFRVDLVVALSFKVEFPEEVVRVVVVVMEFGDLNWTES